MPEETELRFEVALSQLEEIVESLDRGEPTWPPLWTSTRPA